jgi:hypothetical protein
LVKTAEHETELNRLSKELTGFNHEHFKTELKNLNILVLTMTPRDDFEKMTSEVLK